MPWTSKLEYFCRIGEFGFDEKNTLDVVQLVTQLKQTGSAEGDGGTHNSLADLRSVFAKSDVAVTWLSSEPKRVSKQSVWWNPDSTVSKLLKTSASNGSVAFKLLINKKTLSNIVSFLMSRSFLWR